jgi:phosphatidylserine decarboxylase
LAEPLSLKERFSLALLHLLPRQLLSRAVGEVAGWSKPRWAARFAVRWFAGRYHLDLTEAEHPLEAYSDVRQLFTRRLRPGARPIAPGPELPVSPVDGRIYQVGISEKGELIQAKGLTYTLTGLLADAGAAARFEGGAYLAIYLSPKDYHRVHAPLGGRVSACCHVPGDLWPVNPASTSSIPDLFARNERLATYLETPLGRCAVVMVGATVVGRIRACYDPHAVPPKGRRSRGPHRIDYDVPIPLAKGAELGIFDMGSTVVICFEPGRVRLRAELAPGQTLRLGQPLGPIRG